MLPGFERHFDLVNCWKSLLFGLSFFHSIIQERKKFGSIGWNKKYEFNDSDLETSIKMLQNFIFDSEDIPFDSVQFMTGHINYGGRVTDENDRALLTCLLSKCYGKEILDPSLVSENLATSKRRGTALKKGARRLTRPVAFRFFGQPQYRVPALVGRLSDLHEYIDSLPEDDTPEVFGLHANANIAYQQNESNNLIKTILNVKMAPVTSSAKQDISNK